MAKKTVKLILEKSDTGYSAYSNELPGVVTAGETIDEVKDNFKEVLDMYVEALTEDGKSQEATDLRNANIKYYLDLNTFFEYFSLFNKSEFAKYLGINSSLLRRLSSNPSVELSNEKAEQIEKGLHRLADDLKQYSFA